MKIGLIFGLAIKDAREKKGWTQEYLAELVGRTSHTIMNIENKGQYPGFDVFVKLVSMFDISVDQFIHSDSGNKESQRNGGFRVGASVLRRLSQVPLNGYTETSIIPKSPWKADKAWLLAEIFGITFYWILYSRKQKMPPRHRNSV